MTPESQEPGSTGASSPPPVPDYDEVWETVYGDIQEHGPVHRHLTRLVRRELGRLDYGSVMDVGCGPAHNYELLAEGRSVRFAGVDISAVAVDQARSRRPGSFAVSDIQDVALEGQWDLVYCSLVLEHLPDDEAALRNMRPGVSKHLLLTTIGGNFERYRPWEERMGHVRNYRRGELEAKVEAAGFRVERVFYWGFPFYSPIVRLLQNRSGVGTGEFSRGARLIASILNLVYFFNSSRRGDVIVLLASPLTTGT
jgi:SAM-dependent methyltransferase